MKKILFIALLFANWGVWSQTFNYKTDREKLIARTKDPKDQLFHETQIKRFKANDPTLTDYETLALLVGFSADPSYNPLKDTFKEAIIYELNNDKKYGEAVHIADKELKQNPLSLKAIYGKAGALRQLQQKDSANYYDRQWQRILKAMFLSGKGMAVTDPIFSLGPDDGTEFIQQFIGASITSKKASTNKEGESVEVYEAMLDKKKLTLYFMIDHAAKRLKEEQGNHSK